MDYYCVTNYTTWLGSSSRHCYDATILPTIPDRVETFIFTITNRKNAFTVFGLMFIRVAISLLVSPWRRNSTVSRSRAVRSNCLPSSVRATAPDEYRSRRIAIQKREFPLSLQSSRNGRQV